MLALLYPVTRVSIILMLSICLNTLFFISFPLSTCAYPTSNSEYRICDNDDELLVCFISLHLLGHMTICLWISFFFSLSLFLFFFFSNLFPHCVENHSKSNEKKKKNTLLGKIVIISVDCNTKVVLSSKGHIFPVSVVHNI